MYVEVIDLRRHRDYTITVIDDEEEGTTYRLDTGRAYRLNPRQRGLMGKLVAIATSFSQTDVPAWAEPFWNKAFHLVA